MSNDVTRRSLAAIAAICASVGPPALVSCTWPIVQAAAAALAAPSSTPERLVEHTVVVAAAGALIVVGGWLLSSWVVCWVSVLRHGRAVLAESGWFRPRFVRVLVTACLGAVVASSGQGAATAGPASSSDAGLPRGLEGLAVPDRAYGGVRTHQVLAGESLWSVSESLLPPDAPDRAVARTWPRLHHLNLDRVGNDPDVLHPGTTLRLPAWASAPTEGASR